MPYHTDGYHEAFNYPRMSFVRGNIHPRTPFFTYEDLPSRICRNKSNMTPPLLEQKYQQAKANYERWEKDEILLRLSEVNFFYASTPIENHAHS